jgi:hypothetical protein
VRRKINHEFTRMDTDFFTAEDAENTGAYFLITDYADYTEGFQPRIHTNEHPATLRNFAVAGRFFCHRAHRGHRDFWSAWRSVGGNAT